MSHIPLIIAALFLLLVIAVQNYLYSPLRQNTISAGLTGPYHWWLDGAFLFLAVTVAVSFWGLGLTSLIACGAALTLIATATTNTAYKWINKLSNGQHSLWHTRFTIATFVLVFILEGLQNHGWMWLLSAAGLLLPGALYLYLQKKYQTLNINASPATEKLFVAMMCVWMVVWAVKHH